MPTLCGFQHTQLTAAFLDKQQIGYFMLQRYSDRLQFTTLLFNLQHFS